ncbi:uncharacterized protein LOC122658911 [Telopea speciosissima]|uniref:uncharacterized protein LOC122658911 n=1 Tax=Telopea speciosissima TaxID=54955 RepID=UPI001CC71FAE|nr:uncharacterized protein LOC122658911 [Telopea speciosissima]
MSWLARSFVNSLKVDDHSDDDKNGVEGRKSDSPPNPKQGAGEGEEVEEYDEQQYHQAQLDSSEGQGRGVKDDISELTKTLTRQLWGVASFLAPPPSSDLSPRSPSSRPRQVSSADATISDWNRWGSSDQSISAEDSDMENPDAARIAGLRSDFAEIGGKFRTGITKLSSNKAVSEISKIASTFLPPFGLEDESGSDEKRLSGGAVGVTEEVLTFARNIAMHPETWLDFPLADDEDADDYDMSDAQQEHALAVERLVPRLAALRIELCPGYMSEGCFWKIYFVLLHSRLSKHDAELLSSPQIVEARAMWMQELQNRTKPEPNWSGRGTSYIRDTTNSLHKDRQPASPNTFSENQPVQTFAFEHTAVPVTEFETEKRPVVSTEMRIIDKSVDEEVPAVQTKNKDLVVTTKILDQKFEEDGDEWLEEENSELGGFSGTTFPLGHEEDVSFSDLEEEEDGVPTGSETVSCVPKSSAKDSQGWVQLSRSSPESSAKEGQSLDKELGSEQLCANTNPETKDSRVSSDWLNVDKVDVV